jgi:hypothetical protein
MGAIAPLPARRNPDDILRPLRDARGGVTIGEVLRQAWGRLIRKQWLILYPLALAVINTLAFLAVYAAGGQPLRWNAFFTTDFERWSYVRENFLEGFSAGPTLAVAVVAGLAVCVFSAMIRAPYFRAIAGPGYPRAPRNWQEVGRLSLFYLFANLVVWVMPLAAPAGTLLEQLAAMVALAVALLIVFADYVIVYEDLPVPAALRRSIRLLARRWPTVLLIFVFVQLVQLGLSRLYELYYYDGTSEVFVLLPLSHVLVQSFVVLFVDLVLIFLYEQIRRRSPS